MSEQRLDGLALAGAERDVAQPSQGGVELGRRGAGHLAGGVRHEGLRLCASIQRSILISRMLSGIAPSLRSSSWKARTSKAAPSAAWAFARRPRIFKLPIW